MNDHRVAHLDSTDLGLEPFGVLADVVLAGDLLLDAVQPGVQVVQVLTGLTELLLDGLLLFRGKTKGGFKY